MALKVQMYSFKGGAGRTVSTANIARVLSTEKGRRVLAIDLDIESAGLSVLFGIDDKVEEREMGAIQDILRGSFERRPDHVNDSEREDAAVPFQDDARVFSMGAGTFFKSVWPRVHARLDDYPNLTMIPARRILTSAKEASHLSQMTERFEQLLIHVQRMPNAPEIIFFDSASGIQNTAMLGLENCDVLMMFVRWSRQFVQGTKQFLRELAEHPSGLDKVARVIVVPTAVPTRSPAAADVIVKFRKDLDGAVSAANLRAENHLRKSRDWIVLLPEGIPDAEEMRWDDRILTAADTDGKEGSDLYRVMAAYRGIAERLAGERTAKRVQGQ